MLVLVNPGDRTAQLARRVQHKWLVLIAPLPEISYGEGWLVSPEQQLK